MNRFPFRLARVSLVLFCVTNTVVISLANAADGEESIITFSDGKLRMQVPSTWVIQQPRVRIIEHEFLLPKAEGDSNDGRLTIMGAGGSVQANLDRWIKQFKDPKVKKTEGDEIAKKMTIDGQTVHVVDISGTYRDQRGPFAPATMCENYRMLGAIIETDKRGRYFCKCYGPEQTIAAYEQAFLDMLKSLKVAP